MLLLSPHIIMFVLMFSASEVAVSALLSSDNMPECGRISATFRVASLLLASHGIASFVIYRPTAHGHMITFLLEVATAVVILASLSASHEEMFLPSLISSLLAVALTPAAGAYSLIAGALSVPAVLPLNKRIGIRISAQSVWRRLWRAGIPVIVALADIVHASLLINGPPLYL